MSQKIQMAEIHGFVPVSQKLQFEEIAKLRKMSISHLLREAVSYYLQGVNNEQSKEHNDFIAGELQKLEDRLAKLLVKSMKGSGQTLYMLAQLWVHGGPPKDGVTDNELRDLLDASKRYAYQWVTTKEQANKE